MKSWLVASWCLLLNLESWIGFLILDLEVLNQSLRLLASSKLFGSSSWNLLLHRLQWENSSIVLYHVHMWHMIVNYLVGTTFSLDFRDYENDWNFDGPALSWLLGDDWLGDPQLQTNIKLNFFYLQILCIYKFKTTK